MWKRLSEMNLAADHFILGGDLNQWEETKRLGVVGKHQIHRREAVAWHHLTLQYGLMDTAFEKCPQRNSSLTMEDLVHTQRCRI
jgi:hypothetical protein